MKVLHTADIHLREEGDERWDALEKITRLASDEGASILAISGDMFDKNINAIRLKSALPKLFGKLSSHVVILPGNHDASSLSSEDYYGENVSVLSEPGAYIDIGGARFLSLPFEKLSSEKVMEKLLSLKVNLKKEVPNILLFHGELLDLICGKGGYGDEDDVGYMPVKLAFFDRLGFDYVLAGHFHSMFEVKKFDGGCFVYPGSPVSITRKETGRRHVGLFELGEDPEPHPLDSRYYEDIDISLNPFLDPDPIGKVKERIRSCDKNAVVSLVVSGFADLSAMGKSGQEFAKELNALVEPPVQDLIPTWRDIGDVIGNDLFKRFLKRLDSSGLGGEEKETLKRMVIEAVEEVMHEA